MIYLYMIFNTIENCIDEIIIDYIDFDFHHFYYKKFKCFEFSSLLISSSCTIKTRFKFEFIIERCIVVNIRDEIIQFVQRWVCVVVNLNENDQVN